MHLEPDEEIYPSEDLISLDEVQARIAFLKPHHVEDTRIPESQVKDPTVEAFGTEAEALMYRMNQDAKTREHLEIVTWTDEAEERDALVLLEAEMAGLGTSTTAINEDYLREAVEDDTEGMVGTDAIAVLGEYVDWERMTEDRKAQLTKTAYRGVTFYLEARG